MKKIANLPECDMFKAQKLFTLAIPEHDQSYNISSRHLVSGWSREIENHLSHLRTPALFIFETEQG